MSLNRVQDFMERLSKQTSPVTRNETKKTRSIEKVSLNFPGNFGRYSVLPINSSVTDLPYVTLFDTYEVNIPRKFVDNETGQEKESPAWIKLLPTESYVRKDDTGRVVSSLTAEEAQLLRETRIVFSQLWTELDAANNRDLVKDLIRKRNYTIFHAYCLNMWDMTTTRQPKRSNFSALFISTAKNFSTTVQENIVERSLAFGDESWILDKMYTDTLSGRDGFLMFTISMPKDTPGYKVTASHELGRAADISNNLINFKEEDLELMKDPVSSFLGWQAAKEDESVQPEHRRLFNASLIKETRDFLVAKLASIRMAKSGATGAQAATITNNSAGNTPDVVNNNTTPYQNPAVAHMNPVTASPQQQATQQGSVQPGSSTFSQPSFLGGGNMMGGQDLGDLPF